MNVKQWKQIVVLFVGLVLVHAAMAAGAEGLKRGEINTGYFGAVAIKGYDPVAYFTESRAVKGDNAHAYEWLGATWHFASAEHRTLFAEAPTRYAPQYGGYCSLGVAYGQKTANIDPEAWRIIGGKLYLNYDRGAAEELESDADARARAESQWAVVREEIRRER